MVVGMVAPNASEVRQRIPVWLGPVIVYALSIGCLIWVFRDFDWKNELPRLKHIHWAWIVLAVVADVEVDVSTGKVRIVKTVIAIICGRIINPEGMRHQVEGGLIQGLSRSLLEEIKYDQNRVTDSDWRSYPIFRFSDIPQIETILIDQPESDPDGMGELASIPTAAAVSNAIFDATGARVREIPFTPDRVKSALAQIGKAAN